MLNNHSTSSIEHIRDVFRQKKQLFSRKRQAIVEILLSHNKPMSAYEIAEQYLLDEGKVIAPMSVYRIIDTLISLDIVHKVHSINKFIACTHLTCQNSHGLLMLFICKTCKKVYESTINPTMLQSFISNILPNGYHTTKEPLEIQCICEECHV